MPLKNFIGFVREQGVVGLAIGFILGGSITKLVTSLVQDIIQPLIGMIFGSAGGLVSLQLGAVMIGKFLANFIDFILVAAVVYFVFKGMKLDRFDKPKEQK